jgi:recombination protein RecA
MAKADLKKKNQFIMPATAEEKKKALESAIAHITKTYGSGSIMRLGENTCMSVESIPTGSMSLDMALGVGGVPRGRIVELYGPESSGKTTVALHIIAEAQKKGGEVAFIDVEHALDPKYASALGVDIDNLLVSQPDSGEQALEIAEALVRSGAIDVIVIDSVAAMTTKAEIDGEMGDSHVGMLARLMSQAMRKLTSVIAKSNCVAVFINQIREKIGVLYGNPETTPGGRALKFYASIRMEVRKGEPIKDGSDIIGARTKVKVVKNKVAPPFKSCEFDIIYGKGISRSAEVLDMAIELDIINKSGSWFSYEGNKLGQGRENVKEILLGNAEMMKEVEEKITKKLAEMSAEEAKKIKDKKDKSSKKENDKDRLKDAAEKAAQKAAKNNSSDDDDSFETDEFVPVSGDPDIDNDDSFDEFTPV